MLVVPNVDAWYQYLKEKGVETLNEPHDVEELGLRAFLLKDSEGYVWRYRSSCRRLISNIYIGQNNC